VVEFHRIHGTIRLWTGLLSEWLDETGHLNELPDESW
jgi:hypothetical protein